jgi:heme/copper-type cytochrome/quinol oxidase subunit 3
MRTRPVQDLAGLPTYGFGHRMTVAWGTLAFITLEGMGFALGAGAYLYLAWLNPEWPLSVRPPDLFWSSMHTVIALASLWPNRLSQRHGDDEDLRRARRDLIIMSLIGLALLANRAMEFSTLHVKWDTNAYGSMIWMLLGLHTVHLATDVIDTMVLTALMFTRHAHGKRFSDVSDNAFYWYFVVASWVPIYVLIYWAPRL